MNPNESITASAKKDSLFSFIRILILFAVGFFPIFIIPGKFLSFAHSKSVFLGVLVLVALALTFFRTIRTKTIVFPKTYFFFAPLLVPIAYAISASQSVNKQLSFVGYGFESDTVFAVSIFALLSVFVMGLFYNKKSIKIVISSLAVSLSVVVLFQFVRFFIPSVTSILGALPTNIDTLVGRWNDFAIMSAFLVFVIFSFLETRKNTHITSILLYAFLGLLYFVMIVSGFQFNLGFVQIPLYVFVLGVILIQFYFLSYKKRDRSLHEDGSTRKYNNVPVLAIAFLSAVVFFFGANFSSIASQKLGINYIEGRPSWSATYGVSTDVLKEKSLLGTGPATFFYDWRQFKPKDFNITQFWSVDFSFGVGYIPTALATTGILGFLAWLFIAFSSVRISLKLLKTNKESIGEWSVVRKTVAILNLFALFYLITYVPNYVLIALFFAVYGVAVAVLVASGNLDMKKIELPSAYPKFSKFSGIVAIVLFVSVVAGIYEFGKIVTASVVSNQAINALSSGKFIEANQLAFKAVKVKNLPLYNSILSQVDFLTLRALGSGEKSLEVLTEENIKALLSEAVSAALTAESLDPANTNYTVATGNILAGLGALGAKDGFETALVKFDEAILKTPLDPLPHFLKAQVYLSKKDIEKTKSALLDSVAVKPNYTESYVILAQIALLEKDVAKAREYLDLSIASDPQNINLRYERGVDRYTLANFSGAMEDFDAVLGLNNSVANARYFKALSLYRLGKKDEALRELKIIQQTNPDNEELKKTMQLIEKEDLTPKKAEDTEATKEEASEDDN